MVASFPGEAWSIDLHARAILDYNYLDKMASRTSGEKKRPKFDPSLIRKKVRTRQVLSTTLSEKAHEFYNSACVAFGCDDLPAILDGCDSITRQLFLVAALGMEGVDCLRTSLQLVPEAMQEERY